MQKQISKRAQHIFNSSSANLFNVSISRHIVIYSLLHLLHFNSSQQLISSAVAAIIMVSLFALLWNRQVGILEKATKVISFSFKLRCYALKSYIAELKRIARILMSRALGYIMKRFIVVRTTVILAKNAVINRFVVSLPIPSIADRCLYTSSLISLQKSLSLWHSLLNIQPPL